MQITIIGAGNMARGIATRALSGRHTVRIIDRDPDKAAQLAAGLQDNTAAADVQAAGATSIGGAGIVVLALPYQAARQAAAQYAAAPSSPGKPAARPWTCSSPATTPPPNGPSPTWPPPAACAPSTPGLSSAPANWKASSSCT